jgi:hypothetical protein
MRRRHDVRFSVPRRTLKLNDCGWVHISNLVNDVDPVHFGIVWNPEPTG